MATLCHQISHCAFRSPARSGDGKRATSGIEVLRAPAPSLLERGLGETFWAEIIEAHADLIAFSLISTPSHLDMIDLYLCFDVYFKILICSLDFLTQPWSLAHFWSGTLYKIEQNRMYRSELHQQTESTDQFTWRELVLRSVHQFSLCFLISTLLLLGNGNLTYTRLLEKNEGTDQMQISISTDQVDLYPTVPTEVWSLPQFWMDKRRYRSVWSVLYFSLETLICEMISTPFFIYDPDLYSISYEKAGYRSIPNLQNY